MAEKTYSTVVENFLRYVKIDTQSLERDSDKTPSTEKQRDLACLLRDELLALGASNVRYDEEHCYVYAKIPSNMPASNMPASNMPASNMPASNMPASNLTGEKRVPSIGFIAHMDTSEAVSGQNVKPRVIEQYDGEDIVLNEELNIVTRVSDFPMLRACKGKRLIVTDGNTLLGGDDKAGVAEIMAMAEYFLKHPEAEHGDICIGFTPDEEVGNGVEFFDIKGFGADYAYTVDGGELGDLNYECFNAAGATLTVKGKSVHPGSAKNVMKNAVKLAYEFLSQLPNEWPENTQGYEGFYHVDSICADVERATVELIIRDHDSETFAQRKQTVQNTVEQLNIKYGENLFELELKEQYRNMREMIEKDMSIVDNAVRAMKRAGVEPKISPIRGGTDGARLSFDGLLCPNICTGSEGHHGRNEFACIEDMETIVEILQNIVLLACSDEKTV